MLLCKACMLGGFFFFLNNKSNLSYYYNHMMKFEKHYNTVIGTSIVIDRLFQSIPKSCIIKKKKNVDI